ncbi:hypothetical protein TWF788_011579 [Orbilia oligospora]|uniref:Uncharacterized protein n=1 Tax=Orbilia oligospora TaxID=2813651 RepID=A0A6G1LXB7_ORBOL|nr:hypothetical protein TWF788_011579 [Orbilia oligospora]KAF3201143.1 hypothetical protein TWF679_000493 [Orbilia oligospora]KAF3226747.1 hypothetical protein TWF191_004569 [Orbilia oligospora]KAF3236649.1 hypothetical protein TWF192_011343 [Orbilia oligospora]
MHAMSVGPEEAKDIFSISRVKISAAYLVLHQRAPPAGYFGAVRWGTQPSPSCPSLSNTLLSDRRIFPARSFGEALPRPADTFVACRLAKQGQKPLSTFIKPSSPDNQARKVWKEDTWTEFMRKRRSDRAESADVSLFVRITRTLEGRMKFFELLLNKNCPRLHLGQ